MASSIQTHDVLVRHDPSDIASAMEFSGHLQATGRRPWLDLWRKVPGASPGHEIELATSASRLVACVAGPTGFGEGPALESEQSSPIDAVRPWSIAVLGPGCPLSPRDLPSYLAFDEVVDFRKGFENKIAWAALAESIGGSAENMETDPDRSLHPEALHRETIASYDQIAEKFAAQWFDHPPRIALGKLMALLPPNAIVLDAGCGPGHHSAYLAQHGHEVMGVDLSKGMLEIAQRRVRSAKFQRMDARNLAFPPATFDAVWCAAMAMHVPRETILSLFRGFHRLLRPSGILGINIQVGRRSEVVERGKDLRFFEYYRGQEEIAALLERAGFDLVAGDYGETARNTHELDITLKWVTLYGRPRSSSIRSAKPHVPPGLSSCSNKGA